MKICVIGGAGFIGTLLIKKLAQVHDVYNLDKSVIPAEGSGNAKADVRNIDDLRKGMQEGTDLVILLAAEHKDDVSPTKLYYDVNVDGTRNVLQVMDEKNIHSIIFTSSVAIYGLNKQNPDETHAADPFNHYGKSKWQAEELLREWNTKDQRNGLIVIRPTVVFGPGNKGNVFNLLKQIASGKFLMIGKGNNQKSMAYVENIVDFLSYCCANIKAGYKVFNYADKPDLSMNELLSICEQSLEKQIIPLKIPYWTGMLGGKCFDVVARLTGKKFPISAIRVKKFCATTQFSSIYLKDINYKAPYTLQEGLSKTIKSIKN